MGMMDGFDSHPAVAFPNIKDGIGFEIVADAREFTVKNGANAGKQRMAIDVRVTEVKGSPIVLSDETRNGDQPAQVGQIVTIIANWQMAAALGAACAEAGLPKRPESLTVGVTGALWHSDVDPSKGKVGNPLKLYKAKITPAPAGMMAASSSVAADEDPF